MNVRAGEYVAANSALEEVYGILRTGYSHVIETDRAEGRRRRRNHTNHDADGAPAPADRNSVEHDVVDDDDDFDDVWRILDVIRSGAALPLPRQRCSVVTNWTDSIDDDEGKTRPKPLQQIRRPSTKTVRRTVGGQRIGLLSRSRSCHQSKT